MARLITLTRNTSLKRPTQAIVLDSSILRELESIAVKLEKQGYKIIWNDNPKCILTKLVKTNWVSYCCVAEGLDSKQIDKLKNNQFELIDYGKFTVIVIEDKDQMSSLGRLHQCLGRIPVL